ncbi:MAG: DUF2254 domain-containing protein [Sphingobium sp.]|uniref:DUF2254 domain-containing protein n=1 Tax=Sphingobium sp. TaxID=1912891 RepID=UPI0029AC484B|nr:DUF2254 domain-containing protein [Sphingobium sp.]MDX3910133.1 DUF2254 domain-containing protein [Sphingobium sp.]
MGKDKGASLLGQTAWLLRQFRKKIWVRASLFSGAAVIVALLAAFVGPYLPYDPSLTLAAGSVDHILNILATSMLAVTTFSLSIMVAAYSAATSNVTPRSTKLLLTDSVAQNTLATFVGSFLFSIVGVIGLAAGIYGGKGRIILFFATLVVLFVIVATLLRWIEQLGKFGRVGDTIRRVEEATLPAFRQAGRLPRLGAQPQVPISNQAQAINAARCGIVVHIDVARLDEIAKENDLTVHLGAMPGSLVHPSRPVIHVQPSAADGVVEDLRACVTVEDDREFEQDPRFGVIVLSEIASRALSPAVNDPGTAIEVLGAGLRVFLAFAAAADEREDGPFNHVHAPDLNIDDLFLSFFNPITRDGAALAEVQLRVLVVLQALGGRSPAMFGAAVARHAAFVAEQAKRSLVMDHDRCLIVATSKELMAR